MIDKRLMYAQGRRVGFEPGGMAGEHGMGAGVGADGKTDGQRDGGNNNNNNKVDPGFQNALRTQSMRNKTIENQNNKDFGQFFGTSVPTYEKPTFGQRIGQGISTIGTGIGNYIQGGGLIGMGIRGLTGLFGGSPPIDPMSFGNLDIPGYNQLNIAGPGKKPDFSGEGGTGKDKEGIMAMYNPNMLNVAGPVVDEVPVSQEEEDFKQRFRVANEFRQDKQGQLDPAILEMISKLYT